MIRSLLAGAIDYAGLFPPAGLAMDDAVRRYAAYRSGEDAWALGRFVVPAARLGELATAAGATPGAWTAGQQPWRISALVGGDGAADFVRIATFNDEYESRGTSWSAIVDSVEAKADAPAQVAALRDSLPAHLEVFVEVPLGENLDPVLEAVAAHHLAAKVRTGGVTAPQFPAPADLARFLRACARLSLRFKATAGLHHPLRAEYPLTYEAGSARGTMFGFLNVMLAAAAARAGAADAELVALLEEGDPGALRVGDASITWRARTFDAADLAAVRGQFALSFGSCSFEEPLADLRTLRLL